MSTRSPVAATEKDVIKRSDYFYSLKSKGSTMITQAPYLPFPTVLGSWTYRSYINNPDITKDFNDLEFGRGELIIEQLAPEVFSGRLSFNDTYQFRLSGWTDFTLPCAVRFQGIGDTKDSLGHVYDYIGHFIPMWSNGVNQRPALVGSVVRTVPHSDGKAKAGDVTSWIAVKRT
jgi:hypothetical protein